MSQSAKTNLATLRLRSQVLATDKLPTPLDTVRWLGGMQGQDLPGVKWAIAQRCVSATLAEVNRAFDSGQIVRSWPFRGTLHVTAAEDLVWMLDLTAQRTLAGFAGRHRQLGLDSATFASAARIAVSNLEGGRQLSRDELFTAFTAGGVTVDGQRGAHLLLTLCNQKLLCLGPTRGTGQAIVLLDEWITKRNSPEPEEGLARLAERYFTGHGPATLADFVWWSKLKIVEARRGLAAAKNLQRLTLDGEDYWLAENIDPTSPVTPDPGVTLLPGFDEYILGYRDRSAVLAAEHSELIVPGGNGMFLATMVSKGQVTGTWRKKIRTKSVAIQANPFSPIAAAETHDLDSAARDYARYLGLELAPDF